MPKTKEVITYMDEFLILLQAKLDEIKSKENVNADIDKLQNQLDKLKVHAEIDPKTISELTRQLEGILNQKIVISDVSINSGNVVKDAQQTGRQIGNAINQGVTNATNKANKALKSFTDLRSFSELNKSISNFHVDTSELKNYKTILDDVKNTYAEFGQVKISNEIFKDGILEKFKVNIEQVNGDLKETKSFIMALNDEKDAFVFNGLISGSESIVQHLDKTKNAVNQTAEAINALKEKAEIDKIQLSIDTGETESKIDALVAKTNQWTDVNGNARISTQSLTEAFDKLSIAANEYIKTPTEENQKKILEINEQLGLEYKKVTNEIRTMNAELAKDSAVDSLRQQYQNFYSENGKAHKAFGNQLKSAMSELAHGAEVPKQRLGELKRELVDTKNVCKELGLTGQTWFQELGDKIKQLSTYLSGAMVISQLTSTVRSEISELKELDGILTEISKTADLTSQQLKELGNSSFESASEYGRTASDYLTGVQEMYRAGFKNAEEMAKLSLLVQAAGDMAPDSSNDYLMATNAAYDYKGSVEELNKVLDSQNYITNNAAVSMQDMADATSEAASISAQYGVGIEELSSLIAVAVSKTRETGSEVGNALKSIFVTLQDTTSKPVVEAFDAVGISMTKIIDGSERLKTPIELLKELSTAFNELPEGDTKRANILTDIGKKYHANTLSAILSDWESYESMLDLYANGMGSAAKEAEKSANNIEGSFNRLKNTWIDTVENVINSDAILMATKALNSMLSVVNSVTDKFSSLGTIGLGAGLFAGVKNTGKCRMSVRIS